MHSNINMHVQCVGKSTNNNAGHPTVLTYDEEKEIVAICQAMQDTGFGLTWEMVAQVVKVVKFKMELRWSCRSHLQHLK